MKKFLIYPILIFWITNSIAQTSNNISFKGKWKSFYNDTIKVENKDDVFSSPIDLIAKSKVKHRFKYKNDTLWHYITCRKVPTYKGTIDKKLKTKNAIQINGDYYTSVSYKELGLKNENHVDEYHVMVRDKINPSREKSIGTKITYIIPRNYYGAIWIAFNQPTGETPKYDSTGNPVLIIPENGMLKTKLHEDVFATANKYYVILKTNNDSNYSKYISYDKFERFDYNKYNEKDTLAIMCGYNQDAREDINKRFSQSIEGNVMTIFIGTVNDVEKNNLFPWYYFDK